MSSKENSRTAEIPPSTLAGQVLHSRALPSQNHYDIVGKLPSEIISAIFRFSLHPPSLEEIFGESLNWHVNPQDAPPTQLALVAVCRRWREIAVNDPQLWHTVSMRLNKQTSQSSDAGFKNWVSRSRGLPLLIRLDWVPIPEEGDQKSYQPQFSIGERLVNTLLTFASRVAILSIRLPAKCIFPLHESPSEWPLLEAVSIEYVSGSADDELDTYARTWRKLDFDDAPELDHIRLSNCFLDDRSAGWANLTVFDAQRLSPSECLRVLQAAPQLLECSFDDMESVEDHDPLPTVVHPTLSHLHVHDVPHQVWSHMTCPQLESIRIFLNDYRLVDGPIEFLRRSECSLRALYLIDQPGRPDDLMQLLELNPSLELLTTSTIGEDLLQRLADTSYYSDPDNNTEAPFLPNLLCLQYNGPRHFSWSYIPSIAANRPPDEVKSIRRPLLFAGFFLRLEEEDTGIIDRSSVDAIIETRNAGLHLFIKDLDHRQTRDYVELSMDSYGIDLGGLNVEILGLSARLSEKHELRWKQIGRLLQNTSLI